MRFDDIKSNPILQQLIPRPDDQRSGLLSPTRLGDSQQLYKPANVFNSTNPNSHTTTAGGRNFNCPFVEDKSLVYETKDNAYLSSNQNSKHISFIHSGRSNSGTIKKQEMENSCLEDIWKAKVQKLGWSQRAALQLQASWARSTLGHYNRYINNFVEFCHGRDVRFPPDESDSAIFATFCVK